MYPDSRSSRLMRTHTPSIRRILPLTSIRFFAAAAIFVNHIIVFRAIPLVSQLEMQLLAFGYAGSTAFFILSGFLLMANYSQHTRSNTFAWKQYVSRRFIRIFPLHVLTLGMTVPFVFHEYGERFWSLLVTNFLLLQTYIPSLDYAYSFNSVSWSLSALVFCWIVFPFLQRLLSRLRVVPAIIGLWIIEYVIVSYIAMHPMRYFLLYISPISRVVEFVTGMLLYRFFMSHPMTEHFTRRVATVLELESISVIGMSMLLSAHVPDAYRFSMFFLPSVSICLLLFAYARGSVSWLLSQNVLLFFGTISFELIMFQLPMMRIFLDYVGVFFQAGYGIRLALSVVSTLLISMVYHGLIRHIRTLNRKR